MKKQTALKIIFGLAVAGVIFSGYLSYSEIFRKVCVIGGGCSITLLNLPSCVYGFVMYLAVLTFAIIGLKAKK